MYSNSFGLIGHYKIFNDVRLQIGQTIKAVYYAILHNETHKGYFNQ